MESTDRKHCVAYLAEAPKSTRAYNAYKRVSLPLGKHSHRANGQAEALATSTPLPGVPLQIRNAPTKLMKKLGYGKHYSYNPDFAHPVYNVCHHPQYARLRADGQEYLPAELAANSSLSNTPDLHFLKTPDAEAREKTWNEERLKEWEEEVNEAEEWEGRSRR